MSKNLREFKTSKERTEFLEKELKISLKAITEFSFNEQAVVGRNIENMIGITQIPLGVAGPILIVNSQLSVDNYHLPLATTEGALVASVSRGCKAVSESGGATVVLEKVGITRGSVFLSKGAKHGLEVKKWLAENFGKLNKIAESTSSHIKLLKIDPVVLGRKFFIRFYYDTTDSMGMNMVTIATEQIDRFISKESGLNLVAVAGNFDIDKKPAWLNFINGRGRKINAEVVLKKDVLENVLKTSAQKIYDVVINKNLIGSAMSGSIGFNAHYANIIAAIFAATGQDLAHVVEGSLGMTTAEILANGDLYIAIYLPSLIIGTVGGGTWLPSQQEALKIMDCAGNDKSDKFAKIIGAAVLAGEISLLASLSEGTLANAHVKHGRKGVK